MTETRIDAADSLAGTALDELRRRITGEIVAPADPSYESARKIWNEMVDRHPALIVRCAVDDDVVAALAFARDHELLVAVRGGGHSVAGHSTCDGGLVIDLGPMNTVHVDPERRLIRAGGGSLLGDVDAASIEHGLVTPAGVVSHTGTAGLTLGGGVGWLTRKFGLTCDNLIGATLVLPSGEIIDVNESEQADLLWGLRGGGGNFGIVTEFVFRAHPFPRAIPVGQACWTLDDAPAVIRRFGELMAEQPNEMKTTIFVGAAKPESGVPAERLGEPVLLAVHVWAEEELDRGQASFGSLLDAAPPLASVHGLMPYLDLQQQLDANLKAGQNNYTKGGYLDGIGDGVIESIVRAGEELIGEQSVLEVIPHGGAQLELDGDDTAFPDRDAGYSFNVYSRWPAGEDGTPHIEWSRRHHEALERFPGEGIYTNFFAPDDGDDRTLQAFGERKYAKLAKLKARYDPHNFLSLNSNIKPATD